MDIELSVSGKPGPKTTAQVAFDQANSFYECALRCAEPHSDRFNPEVFVAPTIPMITSIAFASELYLKSLILIGGAKMPETHRLDRLYNSLSRDTQKTVRRRYAELSGVGKLELSAHLVELSNAFVDWRYMFEKTGEIRTDRLFNLARSLFDVTRAIQSAWRVTEHINARIAEGPADVVLSTISLGGGHFVQTRVR